MKYLLKKRARKRTWSMSEGSHRTRFHKNHGSNIILCEDNTVAFRKASFDHGLTFSEKPLRPGEIFLIEIEKDERGWSGHLRIGLTQLDPMMFDPRSLPRFAMPNLIDAGNSWIFAINESKNVCLPLKDDSQVSKPWHIQSCQGTAHNVLKPNVVGRSQKLLPTDTGSRIGVMYVPQAGSDAADMHFIINGEDHGVCVTDIPYKQKPLHAVVDVYGTTKQVRIVQLYGVTTLQNACRDAILQYTNSKAVELLPLPKSLKEYLLYRA